jgi:hypothetical protein
VVTFGRYVEGLALIALAFVPIGAATHAWRSRFLPEWTGPPARLAEIVTGVAAVIFVSEVLGAVHLFRLGVMVPVLAIVGAVGWYAARRHSVRIVNPAETEGIAETGTRSAPPGSTLAAVVAIGVVAADWGTRTIDALHHGMSTTDTLWYHMPFAARFVQQGTIDHLHYVDSEAVTVFFPASSELIHALGIMFMGSDVLSPLINLAWGAVALLAGWCIGRPYGVAPITLTGVAVLMATPGLVATQPGGAYDDIVGLALLLSCAALLVTSVSAGVSARLTGQAVAALAAGLALGTKFTFIAPVGALTIGIWVLARRGRRMREAGLWLLLVIATGGFWYLRNLIAVGNPLPSLHIHLGPLALPSPFVPTPTSTVAHFLFDGHAWHQYLLPGLRLSFGPAWWALFALAGAGLVLGAGAGPGRMPRMLAWVGIAASVAFLVTPQYLTILGAPVYFVDNVRYGDLALVLGLVLLPLVPLVKGNRRSWLILTGYLVILGVTQLDGTIWPINVLAQRFGYPIGGTDSLVGLLFGVVVIGAGLVVVGLRSNRPGWKPPTMAVVGFCVVVLASGFGLQQFYLRNRFTHPDSLTIARNISNARIAVAGDFAQLQYQFYGRTLSNYVQFVGQSEPHGGYAPIATCAGWRQALNRGRFDYVVTTTGLVANRRDLISRPTSYEAWTGTDPASTLVRRAVSKVRDQNLYIGYSLFRLRGLLNPAGCPPTGPLSSPTTS